MKNEQPKQSKKYEDDYQEYMLTQKYNNQFTVEFWL